MYNRNAGRTGYGVSEYAVFVWSVALVWSFAFHGTAFGEWLCIMVLGVAFVAWVCWMLFCLTIVTLSVIPGSFVAKWCDENSHIGDGYIDNRGI